ncbi:MAG: branched-chain amino acid ABC transporter permease [Nitratireductor sp.]|nr:branched-chain amino acid ABC transporter permease [Nitratireductor sp.]
MTREQKSLWLHAAVVLVLGALYFVLPEYHAGNLARIMVLAVYAMGYNLLFGYTGLLSLGHAMFFAAGMYGFGLAVNHGGLPAGAAVLIGIAATLVVSVVVGFLALRTRDVAFMIVMLMFAQTGYLIILYFGEFTRGDEGFVVQQAQRGLFGFDLSAQGIRYWAALILFSACLLGIAKGVNSRFGKALVAVRENEERARMLGYDTHRLKFLAVVLSGVLSGAAGAAYGLLFGYIGSTFATVQYSIFPLLWVLLGGAGTTLGPFVGVLFMFYLIDLSSFLTDAYMFIAGIALLLLTMFAPKGIVGQIRASRVPWLP